MSRHLVPIVSLLRVSVSILAIVWNSPKEHDLMIQTFVAVRTARPDRPLMTILRTTGSFEVAGGPTRERSCARVRHGRVNAWMCVGDERRRDDYGGNSRGLTLDWVRGGGGHCWGVKRCRKGCRVDAGARLPHGIAPDAWPGLLLRKRKQQGDDDEEAWV